MCPAVRRRARRYRSPTAWRYGALGTDTGGSCRIPAAFNGIVGYKPTQRRVPLDGGVPLSFSLDSYRPAGALGRLLRDARCRARR